MNTMGFFENSTETLQFYKQITYDYLGYIVYVARCHENRKGISRRPATKTLIALCHVCWISICQSLADKSILLLAYKTVANISPTHNVNTLSNCFKYFNIHSF